MIIGYSNSYHEYKDFWKSRGSKSKGDFKIMPGRLSRLLLEEAVDPGEEFGGGKGLDDIIVRAQTEPLDHVFLVAGGRQHNDRHVANGRGLPEALQQFE